MRKLIPAILVTSAVALYALKKLYDHNKKEKDLSKENKPVDKSDVQPKTEEGMKLLHLQVDLVLANYIDEKIFLVQHHIVCDDEKQKEDMITAFKNEGYIVLKRDDHITIEKVMFKDDDAIKNEVINVAESVSKQNAVYQGFGIIPQ